MGVGGEQNMADDMWYCLQCRCARFKSFNAGVRATLKKSIIFFLTIFKVPLHFFIYTHARIHENTNWLVYPSNAIFVQSIGTQHTAYLRFAHVKANQVKAKQPTFVAISIFTVCIHAHAAYETYTSERMYGKTDSEKWFSRDQNAKSMMLPAKQPRPKESTNSAHAHTESEKSDLLHFRFPCKRSKSVELHNFRFNVKMRSFEVEQNFVRFDWKQFERNMDFDSNILRAKSQTIYMQVCVCVWN